MNVLEDLMYRGLLHQVTDLDGLAERLAQGPVTLYNGFDPTADSLTIGNLVPLLMLRRFQLAGHHPICLVGGGTGLIGDPGRQGPGAGPQPGGGGGSLHREDPRPGGALPRLRGERRIPPRLVNNLDWLSGVTAIELMRDVGKHFPVPYMLAKESVASRLKTGISYTEFSYMVLQAYDFLQLHRRLGCELQTGGSDQWGNITAGSDLIRRADGAKAFGLTCPLVTSADGAKFGKTEAGALWLSPERTSPYEFYQYWINTDDRNVAAYLKIFTFLSPDEIAQLEESAAADPGAREAQRTLAREATAVVHGPGAASQAERISRALFQGKVRELREEDLELAFDGVPSHTMEGEEQGLVELLAEAGVSSSRRQARQDIGAGAIWNQRRALHRGVPPRGTGRPPPRPLRGDPPGEEPVLPGAVTGAGAAWRRWASLSAATSACGSRPTHRSRPPESRCRRPAAAPPRRARPR